MNQDFVNEAINQAFSGNWEKAAEANLRILTENPKDVDALNRLARAYSELGNLKKAKETSQKALNLDPFNPIATKALEKWKSLKKTDVLTTRLSNPQSFLEEPGKTKLVTLLYPGSPKLLAKIDDGDEVKLNTKSHRVCVVSADGKYIGRLPDDLSARLKKLVNLGNAYSAYVKSINNKEVKEFIRETSRSKKLTDVASFSTEKIEYTPFTPPELVHKKEEIAEEDEEE